MSLRLGIMLSGGGRTMVNIAEKISQGTLDAEIVCVISSRSTVAGVVRSAHVLSGGSRRGGVALGRG